MQSALNSSDFDPVRVAETYLELAPSHRPYVAVLIELAKVAWDGSLPALFYRDVARLLNTVPWLADGWIDADAIHALSNLPITDAWLEKDADWAVPRGIWRRRSKLVQLEGLVLLVALRGGDAAKVQLARAIDLIDQGLISDRRGTAKRTKRRHPLKNILLELGWPQDMAGLARALSHVIPKVRVLYPEFAQFLYDAIYPLVTGRTSTWSPSAHSDDFLGLDKDECCEDEIATEMPMLDSQPRGLRAFNAADLVNELAVLLVELSKDERIAAASLTPVWRGESTWDFYDSIYRISRVATWLSPFLRQRADLSMLQSVSQSIHRMNRPRAIARVRSWRAIERIEPTTGPSPKALVAPPNADRRHGIFHLRGLLVLGRFRGVAETNVDADRQLCELISDLERGARFPLPDDLIADGFPDQHPLEPILNRIGKPKSLEALSAILRSLLPEISHMNPAAGQLLGEVYLNLLSDERPATTGASGSHRSKKRRSGFKTRRIHVPTREQALPGESKEEAEPGLVAFRRSEASKPGTKIKEEIQWVHQKIWGSNPLLIRDHIESVSDAEMRLIIRIIQRRVDADLKANRHESVRIGIVAVLTALTGCGPTTFAQADSRLGRRRNGNSRPRLCLKEGIFEMPVLRPDAAFKATHATASMLEKTVSVVSLSLPPKLCEWINSSLESSNDPWKWRQENLRAALKEYFASVEDEIGSGISLARVRNFARARLREVTRDTSKTMLLCGDTFGLSTAPLYYANFPLQDLDASFRQAMWPVLGDVHTSATDKGPVESGRVGSQLLVTENAARELARSPSAPMNASGKGRLEDRRRVQDHNALTNHVLCMLMAVGGHRPTGALLKLGRFDFDIDQPAAIFSDKQCDPAHLFRYAPTADLIAQQVAQYLRHLRGLVQEIGNEPLLSLRAGQSLSGDAPIFFHLACDGAPVELDMASWRATLPSNWSALPLNWGRTWLASRGREANIEADHLAIVLGHLEATGYPYSRESPLEPAQLSKKVSGPLGSLARSAGWVLRKGLNADAPLDELLMEAGPLRNWRCERQELATHMRQFQIEVNQTRRSQVRAKREEAERLACTIMRETISADIPSLDELAKLPPLPQTQDAGSVPLNHGMRISQDELEAIEKTVENAAGTDRILAIAAQNSLYRYFKHAVKRLGWECPIPSPWLAPPTQEPSPFFPGLFRATVQLRILRDHFGRIPSRPSAGTAFTDFEWACGVSAMALCIFSFEDDPLRMRHILSARGSITSSSAIDDLLLLTTDDRARSAGVRSLAAVALARLQRDHPAEPLPAPERLEEVLAAQMPNVLAGSADELLGRLCATVEIANRVELSGLARLANSSLSGCANMTVARQRQFLEEGWGAVDSMSLPSERMDDSAQIRGRRSKPSEVHSDYRRLSDALFIGMGPKKFRLTGESLSQANIGAFRGPLTRELQALLSGEKLSPMVACIATYALHMTVVGTAEKKEPAWSTVYKYITSFGSELVAQGHDVDFMALDADEYLDLYQSVIDRKSTNPIKELAARELIAFHNYLHEHHGFESVDFSDLEGVIIVGEHQVDAELVQPQEMVRGLDRMSELAWPTEKGRKTDPVLTRLNRQTHVFSLLLRASGARHNEVAGLRFKDVLANQESTLLILRPSRYRRLKTSAGRRSIDGSRRLTRAQRRVISEWIAAEKARLGDGWRSTLPIFGAYGDPKVRVAPEDLRNKALEALAPAIGGRSRVHRVRHLVAGEDLSSLWLSDQDWRALRVSRARARRIVVGRPRTDLSLPRDIREQVVRFGHRRSATTMLNYFHMSWMTKSRPTVALKEFETRHAAAVALGVSVAGADKILQRKKSVLDREKSPVSAWILHAAGERAATPGKSAVALPEPPADKEASPPSARLVDRMLRSIQRGMLFEQAVLAYGLSRHQADSLAQAIDEIEKRTAFRFLPHPNRKGRPRTVRQLESVRPAELIMDVLDSGSVVDQVSLRDLAQSHLLWANRSKRDELVWPVRDVDCMTALLNEMGVEESRVQRSLVAGEARFEKLIVLRSVEKNSTMNHAIAWALTVVYATLTLR